MSVSSQEKEGAKAPEVGHQDSGLGETVRIIFYAVIIAVVIRSLVIQPFSIPSPSMESTLLVGDYLFVSKFSYGFSHYSLPWSPRLFKGRIFGSEPNRGDVVVFRLPRNPDVDYIKRVIGLPGDRIQMINGVLNINGEPVKRERIDNYLDDEGGSPVRRWHETLPNGVSYTTLDLYDNAQLDNTEVFTVPPGHYFMMGDNRDNSTDSRVSPDHDGVGFVPAENLIGRAQLVFFSVRGREPAWYLWNWPSTVRWGRLFTIVR
jgi:signal peptidase I